MEDASRDPSNQRPERADATQRPTTLPRRKRGGQPGNQNSRKRGVFDIPLSPQQRYARTAARRDGNLNPRTDRMRIKLAGLLADPHADPAILLRAAKMLSRMLSIEIQARSARENQDLFQHAV